MILEQNISYCMAPKTFHNEGNFSLFDTSKEELNTE